LEWFSLCFNIFRWIHPQNPPGVSTFVIPGSVLAYHMCVCAIVQTVLHGKYCDTVDVAVKMMKDSTMSEKEFIAEAKTMTLVVVVVVAAAAAAGVVVVVVVVAIKIMKESSINV